MITSRITKSSSRLAVADVARSCTFYKEVLGFEVATTTGDPLNFALLTKDDVTLGLVFTDRSVLATSFAAVFFDVTSIDEIVAGCEIHAGVIVQRPTKRPWGIVDIVVVDPDGHKIAFGERFSPEG